MIDDTVSQPADDDSRLQLAYDAALKALAWQDSSLGSLRNRAAGLLAAAALVTSFSAGVGLVGSDKLHPALPTWAAFSALGVMIALGASVMLVLWPVDNWLIGADPGVILSRAANSESVTDIRLYVSKELISGMYRNSVTLKRRNGFFRLAVLCLIFEVLTVVLGIATT